MLKLWHFSSKQCSYIEKNDEEECSIMRPIRVLHNIASLHFGGSQAFVMNVYDHIDRTKVQFDFVVTPEEQKDLYTQVEKLGGRVYVCPKYTGKNHHSYCKWWDNFFTEHPEYHVIHGHVRSTAAIYLKLAAKHGLVTIAHSHNTSNGKGISASVKNVMQLPIRSIADYLFACSDEAAIWLFGKKAITRTNYKWIPNGIDLHRFAFNKERRVQMREKLGIAEDTFVLGHVGRITSQKNHKFLVEIFAQYHQKHPNSKLLLVGDGELSEAVRQQCEQSSIAKDVIMVGAKKNTEDYYQVMDAFALPSLWEGLGIVAIEAQANGLPCLLSEYVPREAVCAQNIHVLSLKSPNAWLQALEGLNIGERNMKLSPDLMVYDIGKTAEFLQSFYLAQHKKVKQ